MLFLVPFRLRCTGHVLTNRGPWRPCWADLPVIFLYISSVFSWLAVQTRYGRWALIRLSGVFWYRCLWPGAVRCFPHVLHPSWFAGSLDKCLTCRRHAGLDRVFGPVESCRPFNYSERCHFHPGGGFGRNSGWRHPVASTPYSRWRPAGWTIARTTPSVWRIRTSFDD